MNAITPKAKKSVAKPPVETAVKKTVSKKTSTKSPGPVKTAKAAAPAPETPKPAEVENAAPAKKKKQAKAKVIRDSFSFPEQDYVKISELKKTCLTAGVHVKKGEILRAGLLLLSQLKIDDLKQVVARVEKIPTGRPKSSKA